MNPLYFELATIGFAVFLCGVVLWHQVKLASMVSVIKKDIEETQTPEQLTKQMNELNRTMSGVINSLKAMGHQVKNLNVLADYALKEAQSHFHITDEEGHADIEPQERIMLEIRRMGPQGPGEMVQVDPEDMSPEMQEKFRTFRAIYMHAMTNPEAFPQRRHPDWN